MKFHTCVCHRHHVRRCQVSNTRHPAPCKPVGIKRGKHKNREAVCGVARPLTVTRSDGPTRQIQGDSAAVAPSGVRVCVIPLPLPLSIHAGGSFYMAPSGKSSLARRALPKWTKLLSGCFAEEKVPADWLGRQEKVPRKNGPMSRSSWFINRGRT